MSQEEMFIKKEDKPKKERKKRVMTDEQKKALVERLRAGKAKKKAQRETEKQITKEEKRVITPIEKKVDKLPVIHEEPPKVQASQTQELDDLKRQLDELKTSNKKKEKEMIKMALSREQEKKAGYALLNKKKKEVTKKPDETPDKLEKPKKEKIEKPKKKKYSTYKKSIWGKFSE